MKQLLLGLSILSLACCNTSDFQDDKVATAKFKRKLAYQQFKKCSNMLQATGLPAWAWNTHKELDRNKEIVDSLFLSINNSSDFNRLLGNLRSNIKQIEVDETLEDLLLQDIDQLSLAEYILFNGYTNHIIERLHYFDQLQMVTFKTDTGITVAIAGGMSGVLPNLEINGKTRSFDTPLFATIKDSELTGLDNQIKVIMPTGIKEASFVSSIKSNTRSNKAQ